MAVRRWQSFTGKQADAGQRDRLPFDATAELRDEDSVSQNNPIDDWLNLPTSPPFPFLETSEST